MITVQNLIDALSKYPPNTPLDGVDYEENLSNVFSIQAHPNLDRNDGSYHNVLLTIWPKRLGADSLVGRVEPKEAQFTMQCTHPETNEVGCWLFHGDDHKVPHTSLSPMFYSTTGLLDWMHNHSWAVVEGEPFKAQKN